MHIANGQNDLGSIEPCTMFRELANFAQMKEEFSTGTVVKHEIQLISGLKGHIHSHNEGVPDVAKDTALCLGVLNLIPLDDIILLEDFQGVNCIGAMLLHKEYFAYHLQLDDE